MIDNNFIWVDLSTYELSVAKTFYSSIFDWTFKPIEDSYLLAASIDGYVGGIYETPLKFKQMNMPSFWMSYIQVDNIQETVKKAEKLGAIIELRELVYPIGKFSLIRDPLGAGFTIYEGNQLSYRTLNTPNTCVWNELFISDFNKIKPFYSSLFNWKLQQIDGHRYLITNTQKESIGAITEISNDIKGQHEYWAVTFALKDLEGTKQKVIDKSGKLIYSQKQYALMSDPFGAVFYITQV